MKSKNIVASLILLFVTSFGEGVFAFTFKCVDDPVTYCEYQGLFDDIDNAEEELMMLKEPARHSNFQDMFSALMYIVGCADRNEKHMEMLINPRCKIHEYVQRMVEFYKANAAELNEEIITLFGMLQKGKGVIFFNEEMDSMKGK